MSWHALALSSCNICAHCVQSPRMQLCMLFDRGTIRCEGILCGSMLAPYICTYGPSSQLLVCLLRLVALRLNRSSYTSDGPCHIHAYGQAPSLFKGSRSLSLHTGSDVVFRAGASLHCITHAVSAAIQLLHKALLCKYTLTCGVVRNMTTVPA